MSDELNASLATLDTDPPAHLKGDDLTKWLDKRNIGVIRKLLVEQHDIHSEIRMMTRIGATLGTIAVTLLAASIGMGKPLP